MKKLLALLIICLVPTFVFSATKPHMQRLTVILDWFPNPDHAPLIVAKQQGFFKEQGLDVELIGPADPKDPPKLVAANKADIGITYQPEFLQQVDQGLPLVQIGNLIDRPMNCLVTLKSSGISSLAELKGKRIGATSSGLSSVMLKYMLSQHGLAANDIEIVNVRYNLSQALLSQNVDAVTGMMRNIEVPMLELSNHKVHTFFPEENGVPTYSELIFITNLNKLHDARIPRFLIAISKAVAYLDKNPQAAWKSFVKQYPEANNTVNRESWFATIPYFAEDPDVINTKEWLNFARFMQQQHLIKTIQPMSRYALISKSHT
jgi:putative hydroxymethylpyrimidine transport system substrate-binding protein